SRADLDVHVRRHRRNDWSVAVSRSFDPPARKHKSWAVWRDRCAAPEVSTTATLRAPALCDRVLEGLWKALPSGAARTRRASRGICLTGPRSPLSTPPCSDRGPALLSLYGGNREHGGV